MPPAFSNPASDASTSDVQDYLLDMIEQLATLARDIGETDVATHLDATAEAQRRSWARAEAARHPDPAIR